MLDVIDGLTYDQLYYIKNKEVITAKHRRFRKERPEVFARNMKRYRARKKVWQELRNIDSDIFCY
jgi:hypothetical protein